MLRSTMPVTANGPQRRSVRPFLAPCWQYSWVTDRRRMRHCLQKNACNSCQPSLGIASGRMRRQTPSPQSVPDHARTSAGVCAWLQRHIIGQRLSQAHPVRPCRRLDYAKQVRELLRDAIARTGCSPAEVEERLPLLVSACVGGGEIFPLLMHWTVRRLALEPQLQAEIRAELGKSSQPCQRVSRSKSLPAATSAYAHVSQIPLTAEAASQHTSTAGRMTHLSARCDMPLVLARTGQLCLCERVCARRAYGGRWLALASHARGGAAPVPLLTGDWPAAQGSRELHLSRLASAS